MTIVWFTVLLYVCVNMSVCVLCRSEVDDVTKPVRELECACVRAVEIDDVAAIDYIRGRGGARQHSQSGDVSDSVGRSVSDRVDTEWTHSGHRVDTEWTDGVACDDRVETLATVQ